MISTESNMKKLNVNTRRNTSIEKSAAVVNYNKNMSGIDLQDHCYRTTVAKEKPSGGIKR